MQLVLIQVHHATLYQTPLKNLEPPLYFRQNGEWNDTISPKVSRRATSTKAILAVVNISEARRKYRENNPIPTTNQPNSYTATVTNSPTKRKDNSNKQTEINSNPTAQNPDSNKQPATTKNNKTYHSPTWKTREARHWRNNESTFCTINDDAPTRIMGNCASSPDITIASPGLINYATWRAVVSLASDHLPIIVCLDRPNDFIVSERRLYINQKKADWPGFREFTDRILNDLPAPSNVHQAESKFRETVIAAAARFIPAGRLSLVRPHFPAEAARLADERDDLRSINPDDPRIIQLNHDISRLVNEDKRNKWLDHLKNCNLSSGVSKLWSTVRSLPNPTKKDDRVAIKFADTTISDPVRCSRVFCRLFIEHPERDKAK
ncbi:uncharacterized protein LOC119599719 [Lucilia sericata]|uniref:uncharacterized protein LOC119599719 n=1 Tax=Lucilia sericata TaxID=13632 RepID=UPI0018A83FA9|nr:uncharacterized protein LOC119599719 [Lucilia sericata]